MSILDHVCERCGRVDVTVACKGAASSSCGHRIRSRRRRVLFPEGDGESSADWET
jgi:ribosomal protein L37E